MLHALGRRSSALVFAWGRCYFQMRDAGSLGAAQERLATARACLQRAHGANLERLKVLHGNFSPELAT